MKSKFTNSILFLLLNFIFSNISLAQWQITSGPRETAIQALFLKDTMYFAATDSGIYKSIDNCKHWTKSNSGIPQKCVVRTFELKGSYIFVGTESLGIFRSSNDGLSWLSVNNGLPTGDNFYITDIAISGSSIFAAITNGGVYKSKDNGASWIEEKNLPKSTNITSLAADGSFIYAGGANGLYKSADNGNIWYELTFDISKYRIHTIIAKNPNVYLGTDNGIYMSSDYGISWSNLQLPQRTVQILFVNGSNIIAGASSLFHSTNSGKNFTYVRSGNSGMLASNYTSIVGNDDNIVLGTDRGIFLSTNNGNNWSIENNGLPYYSNVRCVFCKDSKIYAGTEYIGIFYSSDYGSTWTGMNSWFDNPLGIDFITQMDSIIWIGTYQGNFMSINNSSSWKKIYIDPKITYLIIKTLVKKGANIFVGTENGIYMSSNNGSSWTPKNIGFVTIPEVYSLAINGNDIWASTSKGIYMSSDNGDEWYQKGSIYGKAITISGNNIISGGYYSKNNGITWTPSNFPNHSAISFAQGSKSLFAATGSGVIQSFDNGVSWSLFNNGLGLDSLNIRSLTICGNNLYGGGRGVWKTMLTSSIVKEKTSNNIFKIFPNPSNGIFNLQKHGNISAIQYLEVYNMIGEQIYSNVTKQFELDSFDITEYPIGIYILKITDATNSYSLKIIKE